MSDPLIHLAEEFKNGHIHKTALCGQRGVKKSWGYPRVTCENCRDQAPFVTLYYDALTDIVEEEDRKIFSHLKGLSNVADLYE